jgi:hypothetical protein
MIACKLGQLRCSEILLVIWGRVQMMAIKMEKLLYLRYEWIYSSNDLLLKHGADLETKSSKKSDVTSLLLCRVIYRRLDF